MEELASRAELKDDIVVLARLGKIDKSDDVGVIQLAHDLHLFEDVGSLREDTRVSNGS